MSEPIVEHLTFTGRERRRTVRPTPWMDRAKCRLTPPGKTPQETAAFFFPLLGEPVWPIAAFCRDCPVRPECLDAGLHENYGWWSGLSTDQRNEIRWRLERRYVS